MIANRAQIKDRIEQIKLSYEGYTRQLSKLDLTEERQERLQTELELMQAEIATLEKVAQWYKLEPDSQKIELGSRERLLVLRERVSADPDFAMLEPSDRDLASGEIKALVWMLGEDTLSRVAQELSAGSQRDDPKRTDRAVEGFLLQTLQEGSEDAQASAAYELGKLRLPVAIPHLFSALSLGGFVSEIARDALRNFSDSQLLEEGLGIDQIAYVRSESETE